MTIATLQLGVGTVYSFLIWIIGYNFLPCCGMVAPTKQTAPKMKMSDYVAMLPVAFCSAAAHSSSVLALNAGSVTFGQIVKAGEPVFSALVSTIMYGKSPSIAKWCCLPIVIGGVVFSCLKVRPRRPLSARSRLARTRVPCRATPLKRVRCVCGCSRPRLDRTQSNSI